MFTQTEERDYDETSVCSLPERGIPPLGLDLGGEPLSGVDQRVPRVARLDARSIRTPTKQTACPVLTGGTAEWTGDPRGDRDAPVPCGARARRARGADRVANLTRSFG
jgi:hypothetical protein